MSIKVHDFIVADLCGGCHDYMDRLSKDKESRWGHSEEMQHYVLLTLAKRFQNGQLAIWNTKTGKYYGFCDECGWPVQQCVCMDIEDSDDDDYSVCEHGVGFDEDCEDCDAEDYEEHMARFGPLPY